MDKCSGYTVHHAIPIVPLKKMLRQINIAVFLAVLLASGSNRADQHALLIGVSDYTDPRIPDLEGPVNDVDALRDVLIRNWLFKEENIQVLVDAQATEANILQALDNLQLSTAPDDDIIIYYSGHGTSASDPDLGAHLDLPDGTGAIVGSDFNPDKLNRRSLDQATDDGLLVGRYEIRPRLQSLDIGRSVLVIFDACFSGNAARGFSSPYTPKHVRRIDLSALWGTSDTNKPPNPPGEDKATSRSWYPSKDNAFAFDNVVYIGAAAENQYAVDFSTEEINAGLVSTIDGKAHGGFTDSLLRALWEPTNNNSLSFAQLFNRTVNQFNVWCKVCGHTPVSLPDVQTDINGLLGRIILSAGALLAYKPEYDVTSEPVLQDTLIVDTKLPNGLFAMKSLLPNKAVALDELADQSSPDVYFEQARNHINAMSADGQLINQLDINTDDEGMSRWLEGRQWLKRRMARDLDKENDNLNVSFRHPMTGNRVVEGESLFFNIQATADAKLLALVLNSNSELHLLYPINERERQAVLRARSVKRIPENGEAQIQVTPPWGTDTVLFYAVPPAHEVEEALAHLASLAFIPLDDPALNVIESILEDKQIPTAAATVRVVSGPAS
ncbi:caspase family protein [Granulosicoccus sp.]|nr:caspase family protein [Granulosicoccus sp.]